MLLEEYVLLVRACHMVLRCKCKADAASDDDKPDVIGGMSCWRNGDCGGSDMIISMVFCPIVVIMLDVSVCVIGLAFSSIGEMFSYCTYIHSCTHAYIHIHTTISHSHSTQHTYIHTHIQTYLFIILVFNIIIMLNTSSKISECIKL
jgi:hypothetical protein